MRVLSAFHRIPACVLGLGVALCGLVGCSTGDAASTSNDNLPAAVADAARRNAPIDSRLVAANNRFTFTLFDQLRQQDAGKNVFVSPASIALALQITYNGARAETQQAMETALQLQGLSLQDLNTGNAALQASLVNPDPKVQLTIANSLWTHQASNVVQPDFIQTNQTYYGSELGDLAGAPDNVNAWVSQQTNAKITEILPRRNYDDIVAVIVNAIYFKGEWTTKFDAQKTQDAMFTLLDNSQQPCKLMMQTGDYSYYRGDRFQAVALPYGSKRVRMYFFLPDADSSLTDFLPRLTAQSWEEWLPQFRESKGEIAILRFKTEYDVELKDALSALGMAIAFDPSGRANFEGIARDTYLTFVKHKTFVEVTEEGTEAAGATAVGVGVTSVQIPFQMRLDRPFFCAIRDEKTGTLLFLGAIVAPN